MCEHSPEIIPDRVSKRRRRNSLSPNYAEISQKLYAIPLQKNVQVDFDENKYGMQYSLHHQTYSTREQFFYRYMVSVKPQKSLHELVRFTPEEVQILVQFHENIPNYRDFEDELMFNYDFLIELYHLKSKIKISVNGAIRVMNKMEEFTDWLSQFEKKVMDEVEKKYQEFVTQYKNKRLEYDRENQQCSVRRGELKNLIQEKRLNHLIIDFSWNELNRKELNFLIAFCPEMMQSLEHELLHHIPSWQRGERHRIPNADEKCDCCRGIRSPSRRWPFSYINHCNTHNHVFNFWMKHHKNDLLQNLRRVVTDLEHRQEEGNKLTHKEQKLLKMITKIIPTNRNLYLLL